MLIYIILIFVKLAQSRGGTANPPTGINNRGVPYTLPPVDYGPLRMQHTTSSQLRLADFSKPLKYSEMGMMLIGVVDSPYQHSFERIKTYLNITFVETMKMHQNKIKYYPAKACERADFQGDEAIRIWNEYVKINGEGKIFCPNAMDFTDTEIQGSVDSKFYQTFSMLVKKCDSRNLEGISCASDADIDSFIRYT